MCQCLTARLLILNVFMFFAGVTTLRDALNTYQTQRTVAVNNYNSYVASIATFKNDALTSLSGPACIGDAACLAAVNLISNTDSSLDDLSTVL